MTGQMIGSAGRGGLEQFSLEVGSHSRRCLIEAQEHERTRLGRELHDVVGQQITLLALDLARLADMLPATLPDAQTLLRVICDEVIGLGSAIHDISYRWQSTKLDLLGLAVSAAHFCDELAARRDVDVAYVTEDLPPDLSRDISLNLFRVLQEALSNAIKHSRAEHYRVTLRATADEVTLDVIDDGCGFDLASALKGEGLGLAGMRERLGLINGEVIIESEPGAGTAIRARAPIRLMAADWSRC